MKNLVRYLFLLSATIGFAACCPDEPTEPNPGDEQTRTVLAYIVGSSNLTTHLENNIADMVTGMAGRKGNLFVYYDPAVGTPNLWKIDPYGGQILVESYAEENSASKEVLQRVVNRVFDDPGNAADSYGMVFLGHATGWELAPVTGGGMRIYREPLLPKNPEADFVTRYYGDDAGEKMNIADLASALPDGRKFDFIIFDACFTSGIESLYDLRDKAKYILASPAEVMGHGYPYADAIPILFEPKKITPELLSRVVDAFMDFYRSYTHKSGLMTVVDARELETLAISVWEIMRYADLYGIQPNLSTIQAFENVTKHVFFDLERYMLALVAEDHLLYKNIFKPALTKAVVYHDYTPYVYTAYGNSGGTYRAVNYCCGISSFILLSRPEYAPDYYQTTYMKDYQAWLASL